MLHRLFRASADRRAAEAAAREARAESERIQEAAVRETYANLEATQEILDRVEVRRLARTEHPDATLHG